MTLGEIIKSYRYENGLSQRQFAASCEMSNGFISMLEANANPKTGQPIMPSLPALRNIARAMGKTIDELFDEANDLTVDVSGSSDYKETKPLTDAAQRVALAFDNAPPPIQRTVEVALEPYINAEVETAIPKNKTYNVEMAEEITPLLKRLPTYTQPAAAGLGNYLDDDSYDVIDYPDAPAHANIAVRISGDSMEPKFLNDDIVFVETESVLDDGEIGIFCYDGQGYIKMIRRNPGRLVSLNPDYDDIPLKEGFGFRVVGRVVGVANR